MYNQLTQYARRLFYSKKEPYLSYYKMLGFYPNDLSLYQQAFTHRSSSKETEGGRWYNNERLEFLGDAVLDAIVADIVYRKFPNRKEGFLTNTRSKIVQRETMNRVALELGLDKMIVSSVKMSSHNLYIYGNALEALIGAVYLDQGYDRCLRFVKERILDPYLPLNQIARKEINFKSSLIEWGQKNKLEILFNLVETFTDTEGHPVFQTVVLLEDTPLGIGVGHSKKESQQSAAKMARKKLRYDKDIQQLVERIKAAKTHDKSEKAPPSSEEDASSLLAETDTPLD